MSEISIRHLAAYVSTVSFPLTVPRENQDANALELHDLGDRQMMFPSHRLNESTVTVHVYRDFVRRIEAQFGKRSLSVRSDPTVEDVHFGDPFHQFTTAGTSVPRRPAGVDIVLALLEKQRLLPSRELRKCSSEDR